MMKKFLLTAILAAGYLQADAQLTASTAMTPTQLVQNVLLGTGVTVSNVTYTGAASSRGTFSCGGSCNIGLSSGIMLTSGAINSLPNAPASMHHSTDVGAAGDPMLNAIVAPLQTEDATVLEFDFSVAADSVQFRYVFYSEEYNDYSNTSFNDVFAFFISGPGIVGNQNIALIPGTTTPVSINTVNNGGPVGGVATGPCMNCTYYNDNVGNGNSFPDGFTTVLTAKARVQPCQVYHIKLAVADVNDGIFDSGVFLEQNSFSALGQIAIFANGVAQQNNATVSACPGDSIQLCLNPAQNYSWSTGATTQCIWVNQQNVNASGQYSGYVFGPPACFAFTTTVNLQWVTPTATITPSGPTALCPGSTVTLNANVGNSYLWSTGATTQSITVGTAGNYTVTVSNGLNCSATSTPVTVTVGSAAAQITGVTSLCNGAATTLSANLGQSYLWSTGAVTQTINVTNAGSYTVTVTQAGGCTATATANVTVNANPAPAITGTLSFCSGSNTSLNAGPGYATYNWSTGATTQSISVVAGGTYSVTVTSAAGCSGTTSAAVVMNTLPTPAISGVLSICQGATTSLNAGAGYTAYAWNTGAATQTISPGTAGSYTVTVTNAAGCTGTATAALVVNALPVPNITGTFAFCQGAASVIDAGAGYSSYVWNTGAVTPTINVNTASTFTVTVTDANGCTGSDSQAITVNPNPVPSITGTTAFCQGSSSNLDAGAGYAAYSWSSGQATGIINVTTAGPYTVTVTDGNGCTGSTSVNITVNPNPAPAITGILSICQGASSALNAGAGYATYNWSNGATTQTINTGTAGTYTVTVTSAAGCSGSTNASLTVNALPVPNITGTFAFCQGASSVIDAGAGYTSYLWNTGATTPTINVNSASTFTVTVTDANGCTGSDAQLITVNANPVPSITGTTTFCQGANSNLDAGAGYSAYNWSSGQATGVINVTTAGPYTVTVTDANGCTGTTSVNVTVNPNPAPSITGIASFCQGANSNLNAGAGYASYLWNTGAATQLLNVTAAGTYTVTVTNAFDCSGSTSLPVVVNPLPAPAIAGPAAVCIGNSATYDAGAGYSGYLWSNGATTQTISTTAAGTYTVTVTSAFGCTGSTTASLLVNPLPVPAITGVNAICQGASTTFDAGAGYASYVWSTGAGSQTISPAVAGSYTVTVTDANGCSNSTSINLTVNALPVPAITGTTAFCQGQNSNLNAGAGYSAYSWSNGSTTQVINVTTSGNYQVTVTDINGCTGSTASLVTVNPNPAPAIAGGTGICQGSSTTLDAGAGFATYNWSNGATTQTISVSSGGNYTVTVTSAFGCSGSTFTTMVVNPLPVPVATGVTAVCQGFTTTFDAGTGYSVYNWSNGSTTQTINPGVAGTYTVTVTDANGCTGTTDITLTVNANPVPAIAGITAFCQGDNSDLTATSGYNAYNWSNGSTTALINVAAAGTYTVTVTDANGCVGSASVAITVNANPVPVIAGTFTICDGNTSVFDAGNGYASYLWSDGSTTQTISVGTAGTYAVTVIDNNGCIGAANQSLTVNPLPSASISGDAELCAGTPTSLSFNFVGTAPFTYTYSDGSSNTTPVPASGSSATVNVTPGLTTTYTLVSISDANCPGSVSGSALVTVNPLPQPVIVGDLSICDGETSELMAPTGFVTYTWSNGATQPVIITGVGGNYTVTVTDANGCEGTSPAVDLAVHMIPVVSFTNDTSVTCETPFVNFTNLSSYDPGSSFAWTFGDGNTSTSVNPSHLYANPGTYTASLVVTTPFGCTSSTSNQVSVVFFPLPVSDFITSTGAVNVFNGKMQFVDRSSYAVAWLWEFGDGGTSSLQNAEHYFNEVGEFRVKLTVWNIAGCEDTHEQVITVNPFYIPNAFTPNGDGVNDDFFTSGIPYDLDVQSYDMVIFNRWGQVVYTGTSEKSPWKGLTPEGDKAPEGTYAYRLKVVTRGGKQHTFTGQVNLIR